MKVKFRSVVTRTYEVADEAVEEMYHTTNRDKIRFIEQKSVEDGWLLTYETDDAEWKHEVTVED